MAGPALLRLSGRGEALVAELLRLSEHIPPVFLLSDKPTARAYADVLLDFRYLKTPELCDHRIESAPELLARDEEVWRAHGEIICRFFSLFESVYKYVKDFGRCVRELREGVYIQQTVESILLDDDGKQLICEVLYLYGVLLTMMDSMIDGVVRERLLIAYYRHKGASAIDSIDDVCLLVKATGYSVAVTDRSGWPKRPAGYPEEYFARLTHKLGIDPPLVYMMVDRLRSEDMYAQIPSYPMPQHRSTALATQARMLYIILFFVPEILHEQAHAMREIVDRHFADNWVITSYMGLVVELPHAWEPYKAAKAAIANTTMPATVRALHTANAARIGECRKMLQQHLTEGVLTEEYLLHNTPPLMHCVRECNVALRWLMLHRRAKLKKLESPQNEPEQVLLLLMNTAQLEYLIRELLDSLLCRRDQMWDEAKAQAEHALVELADFFSGERALSRVGADRPLREWFVTLAEQVRSLDSTETTAAGRKMHHLITALSEVEQFHQIESAVQIKQCLADCRALLLKMIRVLSIRESVMVTLSVVSDMAYAWEAIGDYTALMRARIQRDPFCVMKLRATFLKLVSILDAPLSRINQANSPDLESVSQYYSAALVAYVQGVLQVIPQEIFGVLREVVRLRTNTLAELPVKLPKTALREWAQLEARHTLAAATHRVSVLTAGVLNMQTTLLGVIKVDPKELLHDGIRRELVRQLTTALQAGLVFRGSARAGEIEGVLAAVAGELEGMQLALEYVSDYVKTSGLLLYQRGMHRVIGFYVEQECNTFLKRPISPDRSRFQSPASPMPTPTPTQNFFGRLLRRLIATVKRALYLPVDSCWVDPQGRPVLGDLAFELIGRSLGQQGLLGVYTTLGFVIAARISDLHGRYRGLLQAEPQAALARYAEAAEPLGTLPERHAKLIAAAQAALPKLWLELSDAVGVCGSSQLLRIHAARRLHTSARRDASLLHAAIAAANTTVMADLRSELPDAYRTHTQRRRHTHAHANANANADADINVGVDR